MALAAFLCSYVPPERPAPAPVQPPAAIPPAARITGVEAGVAFLQHPHTLPLDGLLGVFQAGSHRYVVIGAGVVAVGDAVGPYTVRGIREDAILLEDADSVFVVELVSGACIAHAARLAERRPARW